MNRGDPIKIIIVVLLITALMSASVFAAAGQPKEEGNISSLVKIADLE